MKLATRRTTTVPRKGPTIVQNFKKKLERLAKEAKRRGIEKVRDGMTRNHLGITAGEYAAYAEYWGPYGQRFADAEIRKLEERRLAQALQGPQLPAPKDFQVEMKHTKPVSWWKAIKAAFFNPYP